MKMNWKQHDPWYFEQIFKRKVKHWTLEEMHDLYDRAKERSDKRNKARSEYVDKIIKEIPADDEGKRRVYYRELKRNLFEPDSYGESLSYIEFSYNSEWDSQSWTHRSVEFKNTDKQLRRNEKLDFMLTLNDKSLEMGEEFERLERILTNQHYRVWDVIRHITVEKIKEHFKNTKTYPADIFPIDIAGRKYWVETKEMYSRYNYKFEIIDNFSEKTLNIQDLKI